MPDFGRGAYFSGASIISARRQLENSTLLLRFALSGRFGADARHERSKMPFRFSEFMIEVIFAVSQARRKRSSFSGASVRHELCKLRMAPAKSKFFARKSLKSNEIAKKVLEKFSGATRIFAKA